ncbi:hypothetical protein G6011_08346 [Alternaria panax]|uniref:Uncharacterized protein n=1 Tax=Alternaria panax TaxID=48097 RepID=A0AAD4I8K0_9PLEO|nr:hypothetical protein G6011_08346 [Alternaria panax]
MTTTTIAGLWASWNDPNEIVNVETYAAPQTYQWTAEQVKAQFQSDGQPLICCPRLPAPTIPTAIMEINYSRNNIPVLQYYMDQDPFWLAHRILLQAQFVSATRFTTDECYFFAEEGEPTVQFNGRPLTEAEGEQLHYEPGKVDMKDLQPTEVKMKKGVAMRIPPLTVYCFLVVEDSLITTGGIVPRGVGVGDGMTDLLEFE